MRTKIQIKSVSGKLLFEHECENNSLKKAVTEAIKSNAVLIGADFSNTDLSGANLSGADFTGAYLFRANLSGADLIGANLFGADFTRANLSGANFTGADFTDANLFGADLTRADLTLVNLTGANFTDVNLTRANFTGAIKLPMHCRWSIGITGDTIHIGWIKKTIDEWDELFTSDEVLETKRGTTEFNQIQACYEAYKTYYNFLQKNKKP